MKFPSQLHMFWGTESFQRTEHSPLIHITCNPNFQTRNLPQIWQFWAIFGFRACFYQIVRYTQVTFPALESFKSDRLINSHTHHRLNPKKGENMNFIIFYCMLKKITTNTLPRDLPAWIPRIDGNCRSIGLEFSTQNRIPAATFSSRFKEANFWTKRWSWIIHLHATHESTTKLASTPHTHSSIHHRYTHT